jgi:hypothetical protein
MGEKKNDWYDSYRDLHHRIFARVLVLVASGLLASWVLHQIPVVREWISAHTEWLVTFHWPGLGDGKYAISATTRHILSWVVTTVVALWAVITGLLAVFVVRSVIIEDDKAPDALTGIVVILFWPILMPWILGIEWSKQWKHAKRLRVQRKAMRGDPSLPGLDGFRLPHYLLRALSELEKQNQLVLNDLLQPAQGVLGELNGTDKIRFVQDLERAQRSGIIEVNRTELPDSYDAALNPPLYSLTLFGREWLRRKARQRLPAR